MNSVGFRLVKDMGFKIYLVASALLLLFPLVLILYYIIRNGMNVINWGFLTSLPKPPGVLGAGISNAIVGSALLIGIAGAL